jgi:hypothetical protein
MRRTVTRLAALVTALAAGVAPTVAAASIGKQPTAALAKRAASARVARFGISYPPSAWRADCGHGSGDGWRCAVGTGGQCSCVVTIAGTSVRPRVRKVDVSCFD